MTKYVVTPEQMKKAEAFCENNGTSLATLMDNAGKAIAHYTADFLPIPEECGVECVIAMGYSPYEERKPRPKQDNSGKVQWLK